MLVILCPCVLFWFQLYLMFDGYMCFLLHRVCHLQQMVDARWTLETSHGQFTCGFLFLCSGYYKYDGGLQRKCPQQAPIELHYPALILFVPGTLRCSGDFPWTEMCYIYISVAPRELSRNLGLVGGNDWSVVISHAVIQSSRSIKVDFGRTFAIYFDVFVRFYDRLSQLKWMPPTRSRFW